MQRSYFFASSSRKASSGSTVDVVEAVSVVDVVDITVYFR